MASPERVLVMAPNWLGDAVMALPAIADVRRGFPTSRLAIAARPSVADLFGLVPGVDHVVRLESSGRWSKRQAFGRDAARLAAVGDVALILPNSFASAWLARRAGIPERWGYAADWRSTLLTRSVPRPRGSLHQGAYYQALTRALGVESGPLEPNLTVPDVVTASARAQLMEAGWDGRSSLIVFAPGAAYGTAKRWIPAHVATLITNLIDTRGVTCVLIGSGGDIPTTRQIVSLVGNHLIDLAGRTTLPAMAAILSLARACVSNDSGAMHVAGAVGTPIAAIFGPTREAETAPLTRARGRAEVITHTVWCRPCMLRECPIDHRCMKGITPARVQIAMDRLMGSDPQTRGDSR